MAERRRWWSALFGERTDFLGLLNKQVALTREAVHGLREWAASGDDGLLDAVVELEGKSDDMHHEVVKNLFEAFETPLDREDIHDLSRRLDDVVNGRGFALLRGVPVDGLDEPALERLYWGLGAHLGIGITQNDAGDLLVHVKDQGLDFSNPEVRGYQTAQRLEYHSDSSDVVGLLCVQRDLRVLRLRSAARCTVPRRHDEIIATIAGDVADRDSLRIHADIEVDGRLEAEHVRAIAGIAAVDAELDSIP